MTQGNLSGGCGGCGGLFGGGRTIIAITIDLTLASFMGFHTQQ